MNELSSYQIHLHHSLKTNQIMKLYKHVTKNECSIYLHQKQLIADAGRLPKLLSFFLFMDMDEPMVMIIDGEHVEDVYADIEGAWQENIADSTRRRKYSGAMVNSDTSISV